MNEFRELCLDLIVELMDIGTTEADALIKKLENCTTEEDFDVLYDEYDKLVPDYDDLEFDLE